ESRDFFLWEDLHSWLRGLGAGSQTAALRGHFLRYLERLGFERMNPDIKSLLDTRRDPHNRRQQERFGRKLSQVWNWLKKQGFRVSAVSYKGLQAAPKSRAPYRHIVVWPAAPRTAYVPEDLARLIPGATLVI